MDKERRNIKKSKCLLALSVFAVIFLMMSVKTTHAAIYEMDPLDRITLQAQQVVTVEDPQMVPVIKKIDDAAVLIAKRINIFLSRIFSTLLNPGPKRCRHSHSHTQTLLKKRIINSKR